MHNDAGCLAAAEAQSRIANADLQRVAQRGEAHQHNFLAFEQAHLQKPLHDCIRTADGDHAGTVSLSQLIQ
jgi:hypothetical protein